MSPEASDNVLTTDVPNSEGDVFIFNRLNIKA